MKSGLYELSAGVLAVVTPTSCEVFVPDELDSAFVKTLPTLGNCKQIEGIFLGKKQIKNASSDETDHSVNLYVFTHNNSNFGIFGFPDLDRQSIYLVEGYLYRIKVRSVQASISQTIKIAEISADKDFIAHIPKQWVTVSRALVKGSGKFISTL